MNPQVDWLHLVLGVLVLVGPVIVHFAVSRGWIPAGDVSKAAKAFAIMREVADKQEHGEAWAQASIEAAQEHSSEVVDLVVSAIPDKLLPKAPAP